MFVRIAALSSALAFALPVSAQALEGPQKFQVDYSVSILGLNVARSSFKSTIQGNTFSLTGTLSSSGIARIFDQTNGTTSVTGRFAEGAAMPDAYVLNYVSGNKKKSTSIAFAKGAVTRTENVPPSRNKRGKWVALAEGDLQAVADPISATMVRASGLQDVCNRTIKVYDGEMRADLRLSFDKIQPLEARGFAGDTVTCRAQFVPVSGYRADHKSIDFLKNKGRIQISFAPLGTTGVYAPIRVSARTEIGTLNIVARRFEAVQ